MDALPNPSFRAGLSMTPSNLLAAQRAMDPSLALSNPTVLQAGGLINQTLATLMPVDLSRGPSDSILVDRSTLLAYFTRVRNWIRI
jgi:hypothetical protein